ncbi:hypothetical protein BC826DRAFT_1028231 [Russula brevipes]|nr:hypothetical protein BC826DRAFT_1028231 [Russula brevipes]
MHTYTEAGWVTVANMVPTTCIVRASIEVWTHISGVHRVEELQTVVLGGPQTCFWCVRAGLCRHKR